MTLPETTTPEALANLPRDKEPFAIAYTTAREAWGRTTKAAGIEPLTFHSG